MTIITKAGSLYVGNTVLTLVEISNEEQEKIEKFMQSSTKPWNRDRPSQGQASMRQTVPFLAQSVRPSSAPAPLHSQSSRSASYSGFGQRFPSQRHGAPPTSSQRLGASPTNEASMNNNVFRFRAHGAQRPGMSMKPMFLSSATFSTNIQPMEGGTGQSQHQYPSLMRLNIAQRAQQQQQFTVCTDIVDITLLNRLSDVVTCAIACISDFSLFYSMMLHNKAKAFVDELHIMCLNLNFEGMQI